MKQLTMAVLLVFGVSVAGSVYACEGGTHGKGQSGTSTPATPAPAPAK